MPDVIFDKWANEPSIRVRAVRLDNGDIRLEVYRDNGPELFRVTLASYRAQDLAEIILATMTPPA